MLPSSPCLLSVSSELLTHGKVRRAALLTMELTGKEHLTETVAQAVITVLTDAAELAWWWQVG